MAIIEKLPSELFDNIFQWSSRADLKLCRLASKAIAIAVEPHLFKDLHVYLHPESFNRVYQISASRIATCVQHVYLYTNILPIFDDEISWRKCVDDRSGSDAFAHEMNENLRDNFGRVSQEETSRLLEEIYSSYPDYEAYMHLEWRQYCDIVVAQTEIVRGHVHVRLFQEALHKFPRLQRLSSVPWSPELVSQGPYTDQMTIQISKYLPWLRPGPRLAEGLGEEPSNYVHLFDYLIHEGLYRSSVLMNGLAGAKFLVFSILAPNSDQESSIRELDLGLYVLTAYHSGAESYPRRTDAHEYPGLEDPDDQALHAEIKDTCLQPFLSPALSSLTRITLKIELGYHEKGLNEEVCHSINAYLRSALHLTHLDLAIENDARRFDVFEDLQTAHWPKICQLILRGDLTTRTTLRSILQNNATSLKRLKISRTKLADGIRWEDFLRDIPNVLSLDDISLEALYEETVDNLGGSVERIRLSSGLDWYRNTATRVGDVHGMMLQRYILSGGEWPGMGDEHCDLSLQVAPITTAPTVA